MGENFLKVISDDPCWTPTAPLVEQALPVFRQLLPHAREIVAESFAAVQFVDQGAYFEKVACPSCAAPLDQTWWSERMDAAYSIEKEGFNDLAVLMPCCGIGSSLNDLLYWWPAGFASFALVARDPGRDCLQADELGRLREVFGCGLRQVISRY
jgi:hypothetical protein